MTTSEFLYKKYGDPREKAAYRMMSVNTVPEHIRKEIPCLPKKIYCNDIFFLYFVKALELVVFRGLQKQIKTYDGCYNVRPIRGYNDIWSTHSWGCAFDINAKRNKLGKEPEMSPQLVACFDQWFDWGGNFRRKDGMHFQIKTELL
jgi:hypothetical protein